MNQPEKCPKNFRMLMKLYISVDIIIFSILYISVYRKLYKNIQKMHIFGENREIIRKR